MFVIDGNNLILGRVASQVAKKLLEGKEVHLINCENLAISGDANVIVERYLKRRRAQNKGTPEFSPVWPRTPILLVRRIIRGMLPWKKSRGKIAYKKLRVYTGNPKNLENSKILENAKIRQSMRFLTVNDLCKRLGYNG